MAKRLVRARPADGLRACRPGVDRVGTRVGAIESAPLSFPIIFLGLGFLLGGNGLDVIELEPESVGLEAVAFLVLALALFLDAMRLRIGEIGAAGLTPMLSLGPGTVIIIALVALSSYLLLELSAVQSLLAGTILASTDPVVLRDVVRNERIPRSIRRALTIEAGTNDLVVLLVLLILAVANAEAGGVLDWLTYVARIFVLGPLVGFVVGPQEPGSWARLMPLSASCADTRLSTG